MKRLNNWDTYVAEAMKKGDRSIQLPLTDDECYVIPYPTRRQGRAIAHAQEQGDSDAMLCALIGEKAGRRVLELAEDQPSYVLDELLIDIMKKFGMLVDDDDTAEIEPESEPAMTPTPTTVVEMPVNGGKPSARKPRKPSARSSTASK